MALKETTESHEEDNEPVFEWFCQRSLSKRVENKFNPVNKGKNNRTTERSSGQQKVAAAGLKGTFEI